MVHFLVISIFFLPIVTATSDEFWDDVDMMNNMLSDPGNIPTQSTYNDLSDPEDLPTQVTTNEAPLVEPTPEAPQQTTSSNANENQTLKRRVSETGRFFQKYVTLREIDIKKFKQKLIVDDDLPDIPLEIVEDKLEALGNVHEWTDIHTYEVDKYRKYWANVCVTFWDKQLAAGHHIACLVSRSYVNYKKRMLKIGERRQRFDLLSCRCHTYTTNCRKNLTTPETFVIHKGDKKEFFIFGDNESKGKISIKGFKDGITLPNPSDLEQGKTPSAKFSVKLVTLKSHEIKSFNMATAITSNPQNVSLEELNEKLMKFDEIRKWPDLFKYDYDKYTKYWAKVCVYFWDKRLNFSHHHACFVSPSLGENRVRTLFQNDRTLYFDTLYCKCHSYVINVRFPASSADTFLIHQSSANEFFVFEQRETERCRYTLFIKDFKGGVTLPNPEVFN